MEDVTRNDEALAELQHQLRAEGLEMGIKERLTGFRRPAYRWYQGRLVCDELGWLRTIGATEERAFALGYIDGFAPSQVIEA